MENGDEPAFATPESGTENFTTWFGQRGLTKREYFAGLALQGLCGIDWEIKTEPIEDTHAQMVAWQAVKIADALLAELKKPTK